MKCRSAALGDWSPVVVLGPTKECSSRRLQSFVSPKMSHSSNCPLKVTKLTPFLQSACSAWYLAGSIVAVPIAGVPWERAFLKVLGTEDRLQCMLSRPPEAIDLGSSLENHLHL